jgi:glycosyltransferase involved in cell wall biosynthesis
MTARSTSRSHEAEPASIDERLRVLLVPDSVHWITGTIARSILAHNEWIDGTVISGPVLTAIATEDGTFFDSFDLVHFVCPYASRIFLPQLRNRLPCVTSHHHVSDDYRLQEHNLNGDAIVVGSPQWAADVIERGAAPERVVCIPYGVDATRFMPPEGNERTLVRQSLGIPSDATVVGFFAKFSSNEQDRKGTDIFATAVRLLGRDVPSLVVLIIGPGWDALVAELTASGIKCVWLPFVRNASRMPSMYQALDFYWVTARIEGGPVTLLEAMSAGVCCISTPVGLAKELVDDGVNGVLVQFDDAVAVAANTRELAADPARRRAMGKSARSKILHTMDLPIVTQGVRQAYDVARLHFETRTGKMEGDSPAAAPHLSPAILRRINMLEQLTWAEALMLQHQRHLAMRIIMEEWRANPLSSLPPRYLFRNLLPTRVVGALVKLKSFIAGAR